VIVMKAIRDAGSLERSWKRSRRFGKELGDFVKRLDRLQIPYISHSKVTCVETCARCYYKRYVLGEDEQTGAMLRGTVFHQAAAGLYEAVRRGESVKRPKVADLPLARDLTGSNRQLLKNGLELLWLHRWEGCDVIAVEEVLFFDLHRRLPPVIGVVDLVLQQNGTMLVVDHKTTTGKLGLMDADQLVLYAEHFRRCHATNSIVGVFDHYRLVQNLGTIRKTAFRRSPVSVDRALPYDAGPPP